MRVSNLELVAGRLRVPDADRGQPVYIVDGARVSCVDSLALNAIENIQFVKGTEAAAKYGPDAATAGAIIVTMTHPEARTREIQASHRRRLMASGIQPELVDFGNTQMMQVRPGVIGPYRMYITVLRLKGASTR